MIEIEPQNGIVIKDDVILKPGNYLLPDGLIIGANGITLDGNGAHIAGESHGKGISILNLEGVTVRNLRLTGFHHGIYAQDCRNLSVNNCQITNTNELAANSEFLDIWRSHENAYGAGIMLLRVSDSLIKSNDLQHQMNGMLSYRCSQLLVEGNIANYCSGWGFHLYETCDSRYIDNYADFCCRYEPRSGRSWNYGHMGADAAGFLIVQKSCRNIFRRNRARMCGDGFFLAGLSPHFESVGCDNNIFEENDGSFSPNNAFESTFSKGNVFRNNIADRCNYGFWLGFSSGVKLEQNHISQNSQAGVACENGTNFSVINNSFVNNYHGILIWSKRVKEYEQSVPNNKTSHDWLIQDNSFINNKIAIRIAADQDHGIRELPASGEWGYPAPRPYNHNIRKNLLSKNVVAFDFMNDEKTSVDDNEYR
jgi:parallel beta-helix repeat protein